MKKLYFLLILAIIAVLGFTYQEQIKEYYYQLGQPDLPQETHVSDLHEQPTGEQELQNNELSDSVSTDDDIQSDDKQQLSLPDEFNLQMPFSSQAPDANWDLPYQEACEETSLLMVHHYWQDEPLNAQIANQEILDMVSWQESYFGYYKDTDTIKTGEMAANYWDYSYEIIDNPTADMIKKKIFAGYPVIVPLYGHAVDNPFYSGNGPLYHMLVIKGWQGDNFITHDPGTRRGENYVYPIDHLMAAIHDWNDGNIQQGAPEMLLVYPQE